MYFFFFQAEDGIRDYKVTGVQTCALPIFSPETVPKLTLLKVGELEAHALHRVVQAAPQESDRVLDAILFDPIRAELFRQPGVEAEQHLMGHRPAQACIHAPRDAPWVHPTLE